MLVRLSAMGHIKIIRFRKRDLPFGKLLTDEIGWCRTVMDWERLLRLEPLGMFKATLDGEDVGIAGVMTYDKVAWIHSLIVLKEFRDCDVGTSLVQACLDFAKDRGIHALSSIVLGVKEVL